MQEAINARNFLAQISRLNCSAHVLRPGSSLRSQGSTFFEAAPPSPVPGLPFKKGSHCTEIAFVPQEISFLLSSTPELNGVTESIHSLSMAPNETASEVDC